MFEDEPRTAPQRPLDDMSLEELAERIQALETQIEQCKTMINRKKASKNAADAIFGA